MAFPLKQASLDSVHEKNVRHGHISTLHIWPARRPLAACRAALIATLLPDPGNDEERQRLLEKIGGKVVRTVEKKQQGNRTVEVVKEETEGGILHWGREDGPDLAWFREEIRKAYGGRAPRVLDPFAGGGAIPLEVMRLGCEATAVDINPVAWFILKCTLEYPQKLAGQRRPLPKFAVESREFMQGFFKGTGVKGKGQLEKNLDAVQRSLFPAPDVDLAWHVRAWGWWVLQKARADLERFYPVVDGKPAVAYLWARTATCKNCRATIPLLKTRWLCKKDSNRVALSMQPNAERTGVVFGVQCNIAVVGGNAAQKRKHDKQIGGGTMSRSGATCPCCGTIETMEDIRMEGQAGRLGRMLTAVVVEHGERKDYRLPTTSEIEVAWRAEAERSQVQSELPFGVPDDAIPQGASRVGGGSAFTVYIYGFRLWRDLFTGRQLVELGTFVKHTRSVRDAMVLEGYPAGWIEAVVSELAIGLDKLADRSSGQCRWDQGYTKVNNTYSRFALPIVWDFCETNPFSSSTGNYSACLEWVAKVVEHASRFQGELVSPQVLLGSAIDSQYEECYDAVVTDPPYYDAIPYSDLMDFFYIWLRRTLHTLSPQLDRAFQSKLAPK
jgi:adenine-specific DNA methylase